MEGDKLFYCENCNIHKRVIGVTTNLFIFNFNSPPRMSEGKAVLENLTCEEIQIKKLLE